MTHVEFVRATRAHLEHPFRANALRQDKSYLRTRRMYLDIPARQPYNTTMDNAHETAFAAYLIARRAAVRAARIAKHRTAQ